MKHLTRFIIAGLLPVLILIGRAAPPAQAQGLVIVLYPVITGQLGQNDWYVSDVTATWDPLAPGMTVISGCETTVIDYDTPGELLTCQVSLADGTLGGGVVTIKRDTTGPEVNANISPDPASPTVVNEGDTIQVDAWATDATSGISGIMWDLDENGSFEAQNGATFTGVDGIAQSDPEPCFFIAQVTDQAGNVSEATFWVHVANIPPVVEPVTLSMGVIPLGGSVEAQAAFSDPGVLDTHTAVIDWGDGSTPDAAAVTENNGQGVAAGQHSYNTPGSFTIQTTITDKDGGAGAASTVVQVQDALVTIDVIIDGTQLGVDVGYFNPRQGRFLTRNLEQGRQYLAQGQTGRGVVRLMIARRTFIIIDRVKGDTNPDWNVVPLINDTTNLIGAVRAITPSD